MATPPPTHMPTAPRRSPFVAPAIVGALGLVVGAGLAIAITQDDGDDDTIRSGDEAAPATTVAGENGSGDDGSDTAGDDGSGDDGSDAEGGAGDSSDTTAPVTTVDDGPVREGTVRVFGETFIATEQCVAFPLSNPNEGVGDAHLNVGMHSLESPSGRRIVVEQLGFDDGTGLALQELGGARGELDVADWAAGSYSIPMSDGTTVELETNLAFPSATCGTMVVQAPDDPFRFTSFGAIDFCSVDDESDGPRSWIVSFDGGSAMSVTEVAGTSEFTGTLRAAVDGGVEGAAGGVVEVGVSGVFDVGAWTGEVEPGLHDAVDSLRYEPADLTERPCLPGKVAPFAG